VPLQGRYGVVGVIYIDTFSEPTRGLKGQGNRFSEEHLRLMVAIGHQAALAVEDTSYYSAMVQAERLAAVGQAIAALSHHIKNILQGIRGGSYLIEEGLKNEDPGVIRSGWGIVEKNQEKISNLVMDMLTFSKEREPDHVPSNLNEVTHDVVELMQVRASDEGVELVYQPSSAMPQLTFDPEGLHRAILNVVTNAIDACHDREEDEPPPGRVTVSTQYDAAAGVARVVVDDTGPGIDAEEIKRIFRMFVSSKGHRGTGLGLSVSQKIIREHGGEIRVESEVGKGSRFVLEIPAMLVEGDASATGATQQFQTKS
jgi:signal transduction histidine kinase